MYLMKPSGSCSTRPSPVVSCSSSPGWADAVGEAGWAGDDLANFDKSTSRLFDEGTTSSKHRCKSAHRSWSSLYVFSGTGTFRISEGYSQTRFPEEHCKHGCVPEHLIRLILQELQLFEVSNMFINMIEVEWTANALITLFLCSGGIFRRRGFVGSLLMGASDAADSGILRLYFQFQHSPT
jgi:hypothetical protein